MYRVEELQKYDRAVVSFVLGENCLGVLTWMKEPRLVSVVSKP